MLIISALSRSWDFRLPQHSETNYHVFWPINQSLVALKQQRNTFRKSRTRSNDKDGRVNPRNSFRRAPLQHKSCINMLSYDWRTKLLTTRNGHGQSGWSPIGCEGLYFHARCKNKVSVSGWSPIGCECFRTNVQSTPHYFSLPLILSITLCCCMKLYWSLIESCNGITEERPVCTLASALNQCQLLAELKPRHPNLRTT